MYRTLRNIATPLFVSALLFASLPGCSKDDTDTPNYQLGGTWQLYHQVDTETGLDSVYNISDENEIIFAPDYYHVYQNGLAVDSGSYQITNGALTAESFTAELHFQDRSYMDLTVKGDTLILNPPMTTTSYDLYLKVSDQTMEE